VLCDYCGLRSNPTGLVAKYNNGMTDGTHQATKMVLTLPGTFTSPVFPRTPTATWIMPPSNMRQRQPALGARFDSTNTATAKPAALALD